MRMNGVKYKSILPAVMIGLVVASLMMNGFDTVSGMNQVEAAAASSSSSTFTAFLANNAPGRTLKYVNGVTTVTNLSSTVVLVNKKRNLPSHYVPQDLVIPQIPFSFSGPSPKKQMRKIAATSLEKLFAAAKKDGIDLKAVSGYRSYATQKSIFERNASIKGEAAANKTSARPGQSEHQTGLSMDISSASVGYDAGAESLEIPRKANGLKVNAPKYGFIIRYGKGQEKGTGYSYEPWHVRYVGVFIAGEITRQNLTLEQYLEKKQ
ncbi:peptidase M15B and M15C DD-carboxypeptidase VanY/endolysin [Paenibacillus vortex V453]|uniref:Peptidase M15B and M15C DD-carboxypeptidase VanY/endolysin n=1 Tax=Paenibacillus vortex V453 TaxID=715225 RepID=A0A2R9SV01_9BACL|nr:M15 family metallopeptidase [Paenibacillus vortex]EFU41172.1 peptidase M15B and M15C DD-carboxypeptidase VanY/endolysin [Paenibacillus vortex V453]